MTVPETTLSFSAVPSPAVGHIWSTVEPMLTRAVETSGGRFTIASVLHDILSGAIALWVVLDGEDIVAALTTRVSDLPGARVLVMDWIAGDRMKEWLPLAQETLMRYGREYGCTEMHGAGRRGWERVLGAHGWKPAYTAYRMDLSDG